jgi:hypothetical protein
MHLSACGKGGEVNYWRRIGFCGSGRPALLASLVLALGSLTSGCSTLHGTPARYQPSADIVKAIKLTPDDLAALVSASTEPDRNGYQNRAIAVIDLNFHQFVRDLTGAREDVAAGAATTTLGLTTAATLVDSAAAKTNYAAFAAATIALLGIVDKNYFYEKTVPALVAAMGAARANVLVRIRNGQRESIDVYNGAAALADLEDYFSAGTILAAIADITARADGEKEAALNEVRSIEAVSDEEIKLRRSLAAAIFSINDQSIAKGKAALAALALPEQKTVKEIRLSLLRSLRPPTKERLQMVQKALKDSGLLN